MLKARHPVYFITSNTRFVNTPTCVPVFANFQRHDHQFVFLHLRCRLYECYLNNYMCCVFMYYVHSRCNLCWLLLWANFPDKLPQFQFIFKMNNQFQPDILFEVSIHLKDMCILSLLDCFVIFFDCNLQHISKTRLETS